MERHNHCSNEVDSCLHIFACSRKGKVYLYYMNTSSCMAMVLDMLSGNTLMDRLVAAVPLEQLALTVLESIAWEVAVVAVVVVEGEVAVVQWLCMAEEVMVEVVAEGVAEVVVVVEVVAVVAEGVEVVGPEHLPQLVQEQVGLRQC